MGYETPSGFDLQFGEKVIWYGRRSWKSMIGAIIALFIQLIFFVIIGIGSREEIFLLLGILILVIGIIGVVIKVIATEYVITDQRVCSRFGLIGRNTNEASFERIQDTAFNQGLLGRLLGYGDVGVRTAGTAGSEINFEGVSEPKRIQRKIRDMIERHEEDKEIKERIKRFEDKFLMGEITRQEFEKIKRKLKSDVGKEEDGIYPSAPSASSPSKPSKSTTSPVYDEVDKDRSSRSQSPSPPSPKEKEDLCPDCGSEMRYITQYDRLYCDECGEYK
ncbi:MAG: PH domain-containing protein [Candidatus Natronoplasma sp.]